MNLIGFNKDIQFIPMINCLKIFSIQSIKHEARKGMNIFDHQKKLNLITKLFCCEMITKKRVG